MHAVAELRQGLRAGRERPRRDPRQQAECLDEASTAQPHGRPLYRGFYLPHNPFPKTLLSFVSPRNENAT
jgi:hypothetical protein